MMGGRKHPQSQQLTVVNLFAGPGVGKSTLGSELFVELKKRGVDVELVTEYAKERTYDELPLTDQLHLLAEQNRRLLRLEGKVAVAITDSPLLLGIAYGRKYDTIVPGFERVCLGTFNRYHNLNFYLNRPADATYQTSGRRQTHAEAVEVDDRVLDVLIEFDVPYCAMPGRSPMLAELVLRTLAAEDVG